MSNMYSLLNYIAATNKEIYESSTGPPINGDSRHSLTEHTTIESGLRSLSDDERRFVGISTISVVTRLALEFRMEEVIVFPP